MKYFCCLFFASLANLDVSAINHIQYENSSLFQHNRSIIFVHIPKTAGISTVIYAQDCLKKRPILVDKNLGGLLNHFPETFEDHAFAKLLNSYMGSPFYNLFLWSHMPYTFADPYKDDALIFTIIRDPVQRHLSHKRFFKIQVKVKPDEINHAESCLLQSSATANMQTLYLSSLDPYDLNIDLNDHLESAMYNLEHNITFFGLTEYLQDSLSELCKLLQVEDVHQVKKVNSTSEIAHLQDPYDYEKMQQENWADIALYDFAKALFFKRFPHLKEKKS